MPRRWVWSMLDLAGLICLGQATMLAQREPATFPSALLGFDTVLELERAELDLGRFGMRIFETPATVIVALHVPNEDEKTLGVTVEDERIRIKSEKGAVQESLPVPARADASRYLVRRTTDELRIIFAKNGPKEAP